MDFSKIIWLGRGFKKNVLKKILQFHITLIIDESLKSGLFCRCGRSRTKPFCDGTHSKIKFTGKETAGREPYLTQAEEIDGPDLRLTDALIFCASARFCDRASGI
jgi:CDGSH-type Zn-finger protein